MIQFSFLVAAAAKKGLLPSFSTHFHTSRRVSEFVTELVLMTWAI